MPVHLTPTEWRLLAELARHRGRVVTQADLLKAVWGPGYGRESNYLRVYGNQLRRKLEPTPRGRGTSSPNRGSATASSSDA